VHTKHPMLTPTTAKQGTSSRVRVEEVMGRRRAQELRMAWSFTDQSTTRSAASKGPDCRTAAQRHLALAWRRGCTQGGLRQLRSAALSGRPEAMRKRAELVERSFAHILDRLCRTWLRGRENGPQALSDPCRRVQSQAGHVPADWGRDPERSHGVWLVFSGPASDRGWCR